MKPSPPKAPQKFEVLVIDDDRGRATVLLSNLTDLNLECRHEVSGMLGIEAFREKMPHLVLLDVMMPGLDGYEVCQKLRADSTVPIVLMNESLTDEHVMKGLKLGADDYILKSMTGQVLAAHLIALLRRTYHYDFRKKAKAETPHSALVPHPEAQLSSEMARTAPSIPAGWLRCENCGYMGPHQKFKSVDASDRSLHCPACHTQLHVAHRI